MTDDTIAVLPMDQVLGPRFLLRPVEKATVEYLEMTESIREHGLFNSVCVRPAGDRGPDKFEIVDGNTRYEVHRDLALPTIKAIIKYNVTDEQLLADQIQANALRRETTKTEYARQIQRIQKFLPGLTLSELAQMLKKSPLWVSRQLDLLKLGAEVRRLVDNGDMPAESAYLLVKIPYQIRSEELVAQACVLSAKQFKDIATPIIRQVMEDARNGKLQARFNDEPFEAQPYFRGNVEILREMDAMTKGAEFAAVANTKHPQDWLAGWLMALKWSMTVDPPTVEERRKAAKKTTRQLKKLYAERKLEDELDA